jgi:hypothetical protein
VGWESLGRAVISVAGLGLTRWGWSMSDGATWVQVSYVCGLHKMDMNLCINIIAGAPGCSTE